jgi:RNA polymerase sigma factor (sigma-70 family)
MRAEVLSRPSIQSSRLCVMEDVKPTPNSLLQSLASGDMSILDRLYDAHRDDFLRWAGHRFVVKNRDDLLDAWHDTMIMFYEQVRDRKLTNLTCEIKTYLFTIGYRRLLKIFKRNEKIDLVEEFDANNDIDESINVLESEKMQEEHQRILQEAVQELPEKSRQILVMRFMEGKSIPQIRAQMGYESENAVSVTLSRGLKKLKEIITERKTH